MLLAAWAALTALVLLSVVAANLVRSRALLEQLGNDALQQVSDRTQVSEAAIEGFAAFVAALPALNYPLAQHYARTLLKRYPFLYMFEVASRVDRGERAATEQRLAEHYPGYRIKRFAYESDRTWHVAGAADYYFPLVFQEPLPDGADNLLGLDIHSSDFLKTAMQASFERGEPVATYPFELAEGGRGYVLHRAVSHLNEPPPSAFEARRYALLALNTRDLFSALAELPAGIGVRLWHRDFSPDDPRGELLLREARPVSALAAALLPRFTVTRSLDLTSQPFELALAWQLGWSDLDASRLGMVLLVSLLLFVAMRSYALRYIEDELAALQEEGRLYELANFDALTGLANRSRLMDALESTLAGARRHDQKLAVLFIDLDGFKTVNDAFGHAAGDAVLVEVARRLERHQRAEELLARYGGDEFVWVTAASERVPALGGLVARLRREFDAPFMLRGTRIRLGMSVGCAVYPHDGRNLGALFETADAAMYRDKRDAKRAGERSWQADPALDE